MPDGVWANGTAALAAEAYLLDGLGYDCVLDRTVETAEGWAFFNFLHATQSYGYTVAVARPGVSRPSALNVMFTWLAPFSWQARRGGVRPPLQAAPATGGGAAPTWRRGIWGSDEDEVNGD